MEAVEKIRPNVGRIFVGIIAGTVRNSNNGQRVRFSDSMELLHQWKGISDMFNHVRQEKFIHGIVFQGYGFIRAAIDIRNDVDARQFHTVDIDPSLHYVSAAADINFDGHLPNTFFGVQIRTKLARAEF